METKAHLTKNWSYYLVLAIIIVVAAIIRLWQLNKIPAGLYWDEMDAGYQAYSFLHTGRDYFGNHLPIHFHSLADYRTPIYIWTIVPFVAALGLTELAVRLPVVLFGLISIFLFYFVAQQFQISKRVAILATIFIALSPWHIQYSRMGFETIFELAPFFLGLIFFFKALAQPKWLIAAAAAFSLTLYAYATASLFVPMFGIAICVIYFKTLWALPKKYLIYATITVIAIAGPIMADSFFNHGAQRFSEISIFNDPTVATQVDYYRLQASLSTGEEEKVGVKPNLLSKLAYNKPMFLLDTFSTNYFTALSNDFLFIYGDPNLRQAPKPVAELYRIGAIGLPLGILFLVLERKKFGKRGLVLAAWVFLSPIPSAITVDGGSHASRLMFLFPSLLLVITFGVMMLFQLIKPRWHKVAIVIYLGIWAIEAMLLLEYYFTIYYFESSHVFQYGFSQAAKVAFDNRSKFDTIVIDAHHDSAFMAYLFANRINPKIVQQMAPFHYTLLPSGIESFKIDNVYMLPPGERDWITLEMKHKIPGKNLYIIASDEINDPQELLSHYVTKVQTISYPDELPAFYVYEQDQ